MSDASMAPNGRDFAWIVTIVSPAKTDCTARKRYQSMSFGLSIVRVESSNGRPVVAEGAPTLTMICLAFGPTESGIAGLPVPLLGTPTLDPSALSELPILGEVLRVLG